MMFLILRKKMTVVWKMLIEVDKINSTHDDSDL